MGLLSLGCFPQYVECSELEESNSCLTWNMVFPLPADPAAKPNLITGYRKEYVDKLISCRQSSFCNTFQHYISNPDEDLADSLDHSSCLHESSTFETCQIYDVLLFISFYILHFFKIICFVGIQQQRHTSKAKLK